VTAELRGSLFSTDKKCRLVQREYLARSHRSFLGDVGVGGGEHDVVDQVEERVSSGWLHVESVSTRQALSEMLPSPK